MKIYLFILSILVILGCERNLNAMNTENIDAGASTGELTYLALGDSYTIGEAVPAAGNFPNQLVGILKNKGLKVAGPKIIAVTGWTTSELQDAIRAEKLNRKFDMVTLLIGVNNQYRGESIDSYKKEFTALLQTAIDFARGDASKVFVVSIPDWGLTPFGKNSGRDVAQISKEIDEFNAVNKAISKDRNVSYTDITPASRLAGSDNSLVAEDGLHPSAKMYLDWAVNVAPSVEKVFLKH
ncbi:hypothetical protein PBAL39_09946 [Pedobacter sp. BAL39]|nr:hypothetical protein PBAL39_09946 [Pedobacter sp. BAL39]